MATVVGATEASLAYSIPKTMVAVYFSNVAGAPPTFQTYLVPDPAHNYTLNYEPSPTSDDTWEIKVNSDTGFLESINVVADDQTDEILKGAAKSAGALSPFLSTDEKAPPDFVFDPSEPKSVSEAQAEIRQRAGWVLSCTGCGPSMAQVPSPVDKVLYRFPMPMRLTLSQAGRPDRITELRSVKPFAYSRHPDEPRRRG